MHKIQTNFIVLKAANIVFQKSLKTSRSAQCTVTAGHRNAQAHEEPAEWGRFPSFCLGVTESFCKIKSKFLSLRGLAGGFVMGYAEKVLVFRKYKIVVEKSAIKQKV